MRDALGAQVPKALGHQSIDTLTAGTEVGKLSFTVQPHL